MKNLEKKGKMPGSAAPKHPPAAFWFKRLAAALLIQWLCVGSLFCDGGTCVATAGHRTPMACGLQACHSPVAAAQILPAKGEAPHGRCCEEATCTAPTGTAGSPPDPAGAKYIGLAAGISCATLNIQSPPGTIIDRSQRLPVLPIFILNQSFLC